MGDGSGKTFGYHVHFRTTGRPSTVGGVIVTDKWQRCDFSREGRGVPNRLWCPLADEAGLLTYEAAHAMIAWLDADVGPFSCLEYRLERIELSYEYKTVSHGFGPVRNLDAEERAIQWEAE
jgi:hypothetical protein